MRKCVARSVIRQSLIVFLFTAICSSAALAQDALNSPVDAQPAPTPQASPSPSLEHRFLKNILRDQKAIWTAPFSMQHSDAKWIFPLAVSSAALIATDRHSAGELAEPGNHDTRLRISSDISRGGSFYATGAIAGSFYFIGRATHNYRARETGLLSAEALIDAGIVTTGVKTISQRPRPTIDDASGEFFDKGNSFPSGHAASAWSVATVIASEYGRHRPLLRFTVYGLATVVSISRFTGRNHFLSDVLVGSAIGYGIGRYVYRTNHDSAIDELNSKATNKRLKSKLIPFAYPIYDRGERAYGLGASWRL